MNGPFFNPFEEIDHHRRNLPHWQQGETWQFVTWRLADSLPQTKLEEWRSEKEAWLKRHPRPWDDAVELDYHRTFSARVDEWLDAGHGACVLKQPACAEVVAGALRHFDGVRYSMGAFVVMPNHVHVLFRPGPDQDLADILHSWKSYSAKTINKAIGKTGTLWQEEYWDRMIRNEAHLAACLQYIEDNPRRADLSIGEFILENRLHDE
ncbi:MAG: transposase [Candidatus Hydrogenedentes bacterium]|nr:transposase [Candidatus Hydrogenedentota bacterium]